MATASHLPLGRRHLVERAPEVDGPGPGAPLVDPRHRAVECVVDLERAGPVPEALEPATGPDVEAVAGDGHDLARREVEEHRACGRDVGRRCHPLPGDHLAAQGPQVGDEGIGESL